MEIGLALFLVLFFLLYITPSITYLKDLKHSLIFPLVFVSFIAFLIAFNEQSFKSAQYGFSLWLNVVFPSLFPFFVGAELLNGTGFVRAAGVFLEPIMRPLFNVPGVGSFAFAMGISSGYPVGAKITADLRESKLCTKTEAERLLTFTNNSSPLFITGAIATGIFARPELGMMLLITHCAACITVGLVFRFYKRERSGKSSYYSKNIIYRAVAELKDSPSINFSNIGLKLGDAVKNSINTLLMIGGFIVLFSVLINILVSTKAIYLAALGVKLVFQYLGIAFSMASPLVSGLFEITIGAKYISMSFAPLSQKMIIAAFVLGWGGLSVHSQVASIVGKTDISIKPYLLAKFLQGVFAAIYTAVYIQVSGILKSQPYPVFNFAEGPANANWLASMAASSRTMGLIILAAFLLTAGSIVLGRYLPRGKGPVRLGTEK